jgi:hypothetical protein
VYRADARNAAFRQSVYVVDFQGVSMHTNTPKNRTHGSNGWLGVAAEREFLPSGLHEQLLELKRNLQEQIVVVSAETATGFGTVSLGHPTC